MPDAVFISPHLDDVAFSCAGTAMLLACDNWKVTVVTVFTQSVPDPQGFALRCQTNKGLAPEVDYMALRRDEDREFCRRAGLAEPVHLGLPEAPHRGYRNAEDLFNGIHEQDEAWRSIPAWKADLVFVPQGLGNHADHLQVSRALAGPAVLYQDAPYALRIGARSPILVETEFVQEQKLWAIEAYRTQLPFQFGGSLGMRQALGNWEERFTVTDQALLGRWHSFRPKKP